jgi:hypothetical protein
MRKVRKGNKYKVLQIYKRARKEWENTIIVGLLMTSALFTGIFVGLSLTPNTQSYNETAFSPSPYASGEQTDTVDTEITNTDLQWNQNMTYGQPIKFTFDGNALSQNVTMSAFECREDNGVWSSCMSPYETDNNKVGEHTFEVRAVDNNGSPDNSPSIWVWNVK